ncbi:uncharacterized protein LOC119111445 [Pollicipes pollicipes]|uniref:uncharacterized protein LOC119111445 n=1 Tax=Pollicipes pollicipes TaxID=41117 RepID=UPI001884CAB7|nr:uncharacterized protein LOC119111445 [Pollicipes pollicipes]
MCPAWTRPETRDLKLALDFRRAWESGNFVRAFRLVRQMSPLLQLAAYQRIAGLRQRALSTLAAAYGGAGRTLPSAVIAGWLGYDNTTDVTADVTPWGSVTSDGGVRFDRKRASAGATVPERACVYLDTVFGDPARLLAACQVSSEERA